jgi:hypothetical protein
VKNFGPTPIINGLAVCGNPTCNGCYSVGDGRKIHPPKPGALYLKGKLFISTPLSAVPRRKKKNKKLDDDSQEGLLSFT